MELFLCCARVLLSAGSFFAYKAAPEDRTLSAQGWSGRLTHHGRPTRLENLSAATSHCRQRPLPMPYYEN